jgi:autotransporter-associated beta strand protein
VNLSSTATVTDIIAGSLFDITTTSSISQDNTGAFTIQNPISNVAFNNAATLTLTGNGTGLVTLSGIISEKNTSKSLSLTKTGTSTFVLSGANTFSGATSINAGILNYQNNSAFGDNVGTLSAITVASGATAQLQGGITSTANSLTISGVGATGATGALENVSGANDYTGLLKLGAAATISSDAGTLNLSNVGTITGSGFGLTLTGAGNGSVSSIIGTGAGTLTKSGAGTWTLSGANTYTGTTTVNAGTLFVNGNQTSATGTTTVNNSGTVLGGTGTIGGNVSMATSGAILEGGAGSTGQTLTIKGSLTQVSGSIIELALGPSLAHSTLALTAAGASSFYSTQKFTFIELAGVTTGTYQDIITGVTSNPTVGSWTITNSGWTGSFSYDSSDNGIDLILTKVPEPSTWIAGGLAFGVVGYSQRRRFVRLFARA